MASQWYTLRGAAQRLGISPNGVRMRVKRGQIASRRDDQGRWLVALDVQSEPAPEAAPDGAQTAPESALVTQLRSEVAFLRSELEARREAERELRILVASVNERLTALPSSQVGIRRLEAENDELRARLATVEVSGNGAAPSDKATASGPSFAASAGSGFVGNIASAGFLQLAHWLIPLSLPPLFLLFSLLTVVDSKGLNSDLLTYTVFGLEAANGVAIASMLGVMIWIYIQVRRFEHASPLEAQPLEWQRLQHSDDELDILLRGTTLGSAIGFVIATAALIAFLLHSSLSGMLMQAVGWSIVLVIYLLTLRRLVLNRRAFHKKIRGETA